MKKLKFLTTCIHALEDDIQDMKRESQQVTRRTFCKNTNRHSREAEERRLGYSLHGPDLTMKRDWHVSYHKSKYRGEPCYYFVWSRIEHIFQ